MKRNTWKVRAVAPNVTVGNTLKNTETIVSELESAANRGVDLVLFPELVLTGVTAGDLFFRGDFLLSADEAAQTVGEASERLSVVSAIGYPLADGNEIYNAVKLSDGDGAYYFSKTNLNGKGFLAQSRWFAKGEPSAVVETEAGINVAVLHFSDLFRAAELAKQGAELLLIPSAIPKTAGSESRIKLCLTELSRTLNLAIVFCNAGLGESVTDNLFSGGALIVSRGKVLSESFSDGTAVAEAELDFDEIRKNKSKIVAEDTISEGFDLFQTNRAEDTKTCAEFPFVAKNYVAQATEIFAIQSEALKRRLRHVGAKKAVLGVSGGLDSTLALLVAVEAAKRAGGSEKDVLAVTMPGSGTSGRTYRNAKRMMELLGVDAREISIANAFSGHLKDLNHSGAADIAYENAQARERTQILMDLANMEGGIVVGTGDLSELATGFATYNGDHMSMYGVNASIPKTLMRVMVNVLAEQAGGELETVLKDVVSTPVSPELKPADGGETSQFSESVVGPYELVDFFLYYFHFCGFDPQELRSAAKETFSGRYSEEELKRWQNAFLKRFFASQFKRSCMPDGVDATGYSFSPRGGLTLPSDISAEPFLL